MKRRKLATVVVLLGLLPSACARQGNGTDAEATATAEALATLPAVVAGTNVVAEARVVPVRHVTMGFATSGQLERVMVEEGDRVAAGQVLLRLASGRQAAAVLQAEAELSSARAQLALLEAGTRAEDLAAAEAAVRSAAAAVDAARGAWAASTAALAKLDAGPTWEELAIVERRVEEAKNALWGAQSRRDSICGRVPKYADPADCDGARAAVQQAEEEVRIAELTLHQAMAGPRAEDRAAAQAAVQQARGQWTAAQERQAEAQANLERLRNGAHPAELEAARARVDQALAALEQARLNLDDTELRAPFAGTVMALSVKEGETVLAGAPVLQLADTSSWLVETEDLTELNVVDIQVGDRAEVTFDALPDVTLEGRVSRIDGVGRDRLGDIVYTVVIAPTRHEPRLRWNMTAVVRLVGEE